MQFDELLTRHVGAFGRSQLCVLLAASVSWAALAAAVLAMVFVTQEPPWHCTQGDADLVCAAALQQHQRQPPLPAAGATNSSSSPSSDLWCSLAREQWAWTRPHASLLSAFELQCGGGAAWKLSVANSVFFLGYAVGSFIFGWLADRHGRRLALITSNLAAAAAALGCAAAPTLALHVAARTLLGTAAAGLPVAAYVLATESVGPLARGRAGTASQLVYHLGELALPLAAAGLQDYRLLYVGVAAMLAASAALAAAVPESPRWLLLRGRHREAFWVLDWMTALNKQPPVADWSAVLDSSSSSSGSSSSSDSSSSWQHDGEAAPCLPPQASCCKHDGAVAGAVERDRDQHRHRQIDVAADCVALLEPHTTTSSSSSSGKGEQLPQHTASKGGNPAQGDKLMMIFTDALLARVFWVTSLLCAVMATSFFTSSLATQSLGGSLYLQFILTSLGELPATLVGACAVDSIGRRPTIGAGLLLSGAACVLATCLPVGAWATAAASTGKAACSAAWSLSYMWAAELLPTTLRSAALAATNQAARLGGLVAPFLILAGQRSSSLRHDKLPWGIIGAASIVTAGLVALLPETLGQPQPDSVQHLRQLYAAGHGGGSCRQDATTTTTTSPAAGRTLQQLPVGRSISYRVTELVAVPQREDRQR